jgi:hypothetical protein
MKGQHCNMLVSNPQLGGGGNHPPTRFAERRIRVTVWRATALLWPVHGLVDRMERTAARREPRPTRVGSCASVGGANLPPSRPAIAPLRRDGGLVSRSFRGCSADRFSRRLDEVTQRTRRSTETGEHWLEYQLAANDGSVVNWLRACPDNDWLLSIDSESPSAL